MLEVLASLTIRRASVVRFKQLVFIGELEESETTARGYRSDVLVETQDGSLYPVTFYDPVRLSQDVEEMAKHGTPFVAEPGMIVLETITRSSMESAARRLCDEGFFSYLRP